MWGLVHNCAQPFLFYTALSSRGPFSPLRRGEIRGGVPTRALHFGVRSAHLLISLWRFWGVIAHI